MQAITHEKLTLEVEAAHEWTEARLASVAELVDRFTGPHYLGRTVRAAGAFDSENAEFEYCALNIPRVILDNPIVQCGTRLQAAQGRVARSIHHGMNRWVVETKLHRQLTLLAYDMAFAWGVCETGIEPVRSRGKIEGVGGEGRFGTPMRPRVKRISPHRATWDARGTDPWDKAWTARLWARDKGMLLEEAKRYPALGWNVPMLEALKGNSHLDTLNRSPEVESSELFEEVVGWDVWIKDHRLPDSDPAWRGLSDDEKEGCYGTLFTIVLCDRTTAKTYKSEWPRKPRPWYGSPEGPTRVFGAYPVFDSTSYVGPLTAMKGQADELNTHARAASRSARKFKRLVLVNDTDNGAVDKIAGNPDSFVIPIRGLDAQRVVSLSVGGMDPAQFEYLQLLRERHDRNIGSSDSLKGRARADTTATAEDIAATAAVDRLAYQRSRFLDCCTDVLTDVARLMYHSNRVVFPLDPDAAEEFGMLPQTVQLPDGREVTVPPEPWFYGGRHTKGSGYTFDDLELRIQLDSLQRSNPQLRQMQAFEGINTITTIAPLVTTLPFIKWKEVLHKVGEAIGWPELESLMDVGLAQKLAGMNVAAQMLAMRDAARGKGPASGNSEARLAIDAGGYQVPKPNKTAGGVRGQGSTAPGGGLAPQPRVRSLVGAGAGAGGRGGARSAPPASPARTSARAGRSKSPQTRSTGRASRGGY